MEKEELIEISARLDTAGDEQIGDLYDEIVGMLNANPDDFRVRYLFGAVAHRAGHEGVAKAMLEPLVAQRGDWGSLRMTYGLILDSYGDHRAALKQYDAASRDKSVGREMLAANKASAYLKLVDYQAAQKVIEDAIDVEHPEAAHANAQINLAFAKLGQGNLREGWRHYTAGLGTPNRGKANFGLPMWNGERDATVLMYPEQGLGDEIMYLTMLNEFIPMVAKVVVECDPRLSLLFKRSFPDIGIYGSRLSKDKPWVADYPFTHQLPMGELMRFLRNEKIDFAKQPERYLCPAPALVKMYRTLVHETAGNGKPIVGIAWSGGTKKTYDKHREIPPAAFAPLVKHKDVTLVSLQYRKGTMDEIKLSGLDIQHHEFATGQGGSYEHTAAMIAACDRVIATDTTAIHAAGAMGVKTDVLLGTPPMWVHGPWQNDQSAWYPSVKLRRRPAEMDWSDYIAHLVKQGIL